MKKRSENPESNKWKLGGAIAALLAAVAVFAVMLGMERSLLAEYEKGSVYVTIAEIPKGMLITTENMSFYFEERLLDASVIAPSALSSPEQITGLLAVYDIAPGVLLTEGMFEEENKILQQMQEPVIAGLKGDDLFQVVGGVLRAGDRIHIYSVDEENETSLLWENVYVQGVFDQNGTMIENGDREQSAQRINVYLDRENIEEFYAGLASGNLRVVKVCEKGEM